MNRLSVLYVWAYLAAFVGATAQTLERGAGVRPRQDYNSGEYLYRAFCASCHGEHGAGNGAVASILHVPPSDLTTIAAENNGVFPRARVRAAIDGRTSVKEHGPGDMPIWGNVLKATEGRDETTIRKRIEAFVDYIESIQAPRDLMDDGPAAGRRPTLLMK